MIETKELVKNLVLLSKYGLFFLAAFSSAFAIHFFIKLEAFEYASTQQTLALYNRIDFQQELITKLYKEKQHLVKVNRELKSWLRPSPKYQKYINLLKAQMRMRRKRFGPKVNDDLLLHYSKLEL